MTDEVIDQPTAGLEAIVDRYVQLRDRKAELKAEYDAKIRDIDVALQKCEAFMLSHLKDQAAESIRTKAGTFFRKRRANVSVADWDTFFTWLRDNDMWSMLEHRASKTAVEEFRTVHDDVPPGLNYSAEWIINVRRS